MVQEKKRKKKILYFFLLIVSISLFAPWIAPYPPEVQTISESLESPSLKHWMGTDILGRDLFSQILYGGQVSLILATLSAFTSVCLGTLIGSFASFSKSWFPPFLLFIMDFFLIFPTPLLAMLFTLVCSKSSSGIFFSLVFSSWVSHAKIINAIFLKIQTLTYIEAASALGASRFRILTRYLLPTAIKQMVASFILQISINIMTEGFLSFIGLGIKFPYCSWGMLIQEGFRTMHSHPHILLFPSIILVFTIYTFQALGALYQNAT